MSQEQDPNQQQEQTESTEESTRSINSVLAEMNRKTSQLADENARLSAKIEALSAARQPQPAQSESLSEDELENLAYKDPKKYAKVVSDMAAARAESIVSSRMQQQNETQTMFSSMAAEYPELTDANSELTKRSVEIFKQLPPGQQSNPLAYKVAIRDAAAELGVLSKSKRKQSSVDDFSGSSSGNSSARQQQGTQGRGKLGQDTLRVAEAFNLDEKAVKRMQARASSRKNYGRFE